MSDRHQTDPVSDARGRANAQASQSETYYNGGIEDRAHSAWFDATFSDILKTAAIAAPEVEAVAGARETALAPTTERHLCVDCTMCCNGTLFSRVPITRDERDRLGGGPDFQEKDGKIRMRLGCSRLGSDGCCKVYEIRPTVCRTYRCDLLKRLEADGVTRADADHIVATAKQLQQMAIDGFARAMPTEFEGRSFRSAVDARDHYAAARERGVAVNPHVRANAWHHYDGFKAFIRLNIRDDFNPD